MPVIKRFLFLFSFFLITVSFSIDATPLHQEVQIPMRDGAYLTTHLYSPEEHDQSPLPCILIRTPGQAKLTKTYERMTQWGYIVAIQSTRSFHHAEEHPEPYRADAWGELQDGYDTIEWLGQSEFTNGKIGTFGASANGITQLLLAPTRPEHLKCQFIEVATPTLYQHAAYVGGKFCKHQIENWFSKVAPKAFANIVKNNTYSDYWQQIDASTKGAHVETPALHIGGWYDLFSQGTLDAFMDWQNNGGEGAKGKQKLVMGPWTHWGPRQSQFGEYEFHEVAKAFNNKKLIRDWFDAHLKGETKRLNQYPPVTYYVMGPLDGSPSKGNCWKHAESWPPQAKITALYLNKGKRLTEKMPQFSTKKIEIEYDPSNPIATIGGRNLYLDSGPYIQNANEARADVLCFSTDRLMEDTEVTGRIKAQLYLSSSAPSTDVSVILTDVYPDGKSVIIAEGIKNVSLTENQVQTVEVDLWSTSHVFAKDHQIRIDVSNSNYPHFDINPHAAHNKIHVGSKYPSCITLPVIDD